MVTILFQNNSIIASICRALVVVATLDVYESSAQESSAKNKTGDITNNQGIITQGQQGNNTIIQGAVKRHISSEVADSISSYLRSNSVKGKIEVLTDLMACPDCDGFAIQVQGIIESSPNITVIPVRNGMTFSGFKGVAMGVKDIKNIPESVKVVVSAFNYVSINLHIIVRPPDNPDYDGVLIVSQPIN